MSEKTIEELLKELENQASKPEVVKPKKTSSDILKFLTTFSIEPGYCLIERKILYKLYKQYERTHGIHKPLIERKFYRLIKNYLKSVKSCLYINQKSFDLSEKVINLLKPEVRQTTKMIPMQMHFNNFIKKYNLKPGKKPHQIWVSAKTLYDLYDEWTYGIRKKRPLSYRSFTNFCKIYFPISKEDQRDKVWISLDDSISETIKARNSYINEEEKEPKK